MELCIKNKGDQLNIRRVFIFFEKESTLFELMLADLYEFKGRDTPITEIAISI